MQHMKRRYRALSGRGGPPALLAAIVSVTAIGVFAVVTSDTKPPHPALVYASASRLLLGGQWQVTGRGVFGAGNLSERTDGDGTHYLRVAYPRGSASPTVTRSARRPVGGAQFYAIPVDGHGLGDALRLQYRVRFDRNFPWVKGGKLPGLYGGTMISGGRIPDGTNGFSTRYMWRAHGAGEVYAYLPSSKNHGTSLGRGDWFFHAGRWATIEQTVHLNSPGRADGSIEVRVDDQMVQHDAGLVFRTTGLLQIQGVFFSSFFGGDDTSWSASRATHVDFAGFKTASV
jgi:hypothetical protein